MHHERRRVHFGDEQVIAKRIAKQRPDRDKPVSRRRDVGDRRIGRIENERANLVARGDRDRDAGAKRFAKSDDALGLNAARDRRRISGFAVELESALAWRAGRTGIAAIFDSQHAHASFRHGAKTLDAQVQPACIAMKIEDQRPPWRGRDAPRDQALPVLGLETNRLCLKSERRRVDLGGVATKQDLALADQEPDEQGGVKRGAGGDHNQHDAPSPAMTCAALSAGAL